MPQITLEYTSNIDIPIDFQNFFHELHQLAHQVVGVNIENCKSRARVLQDYYIGEGDSKNAYVSLELYLLHGRTIELKQSLGQQVLALLQRYFAEAMVVHNLQITVYIDDLSRDTYFKYPAGTFTKL